MHVNKVQYCRAGHIYLIVTEWSEFMHYLRISINFMVIEWLEWMHCPRVSIYVMATEWSEFLH